MHAGHLKDKAKLTTEAGSGNSLLADLSQHIDIKRIRLKSYEPLYQALLENQAKYNAPMLRRLKQDIYELVLTSKPTGRIRTVNLEDEKLEDVEVVIGVGIPADFGQKGYAGITAEDIYADVVYDDREYEIDRIVTTTLPSLLPNNSILPMHKYISQYVGDLSINPDKIIKDFDGFIASTRNRPSNRIPMLICSRMYSSALLIRANTSP